MTDSTNENLFQAFEQINQVCRDFRKQISRGTSPRIEDFLTQVVEDGRQNLFSNLLEIEVNFRQRNGKEPTTEEYIKRFPEFKKQVRRAFFEPSMGSVDEDVSTDSDGHTESFRNPEQDANAFAPTHELPDANRLGDYELIRELGRGGFGVVYEARHIKTNNRVALKTLPTGGDGHQVNADRLYRFRREFRTLSEINHPNLVGMQSLEVDGSQWFFTMDLIDGEDFLSYVRPDDAFDESRLRHCLSQLAEGVISLHRRGIIHRDLKPSNVLVSDEGRVSILDFGLAAELQKANDITQTRSGMFAGTPRYAAPEQMFGERTEASDWYAFGTMLYEALTGQPPFAGKDQVALLRQKQEQDPRRLSDHVGLPMDLAELADGLVCREPDVRLTAESISECLRLDQETRVTGSTQGSHDSARSVGEDEEVRRDFDEKEIVLIGRKQQLAELEEIKEKFLEKREPLVVWITGKSGEGKSSLAEKFIRPLRRDEKTLVLSGRCYDRESVPFKVIDSIIDPLVSFLRSQPDTNVERMLPLDIEMLARLFPVLRRVKPIDQRIDRKRSEIDERTARNLAFAAFADLLVSLSQHTSVLIYIDDLQWGDADSAQVLFDLLTKTLPPSIMLLGGYRSDESSDSPFLANWRSCVASRTTSLAMIEVRVGPLTSGQCLDVAAQRIGCQLTELGDLSPRLFADSGGNPYFLDQLIEGFDASGQTTWAVPLSEIIAKRLARLPPEAERLLGTIAVAGQALAVDEAAEAIGEVGQVLAVLTRMRNEKLVRLIDNADHPIVDTYHDKIRETILAQMESPVRREFHGLLARTIERREKLDGPTLFKATSQDTSARLDIKLVSPRVFDLSYHFDSAGDSTAAFHYSVLAAELAGSQFALDSAKEKYEIARQHCDSSPTQDRYRLFAGYGETLLKAGDYDQANHELDEAIALAPDSRDRLTLQAHKADIVNKTTSLDESISACENLLRELGVRIPSSRLSFVANILWQRICQFTHSLNLGLRRQTTRDPDWRSALKLKLLSLLIHSHTFRDPLADTWAILFSFNIGRRFPEWPRISAYYAYRGFLGTIFSNWGTNAGGVRYLSEGVQIAERFGDESLIANALFFQAWGLLSIGQLEQAHRSASRSLELYERTADAWRVVYARWMISWIDSRLGNLPAAIEQSRETLGAAVRFGQNRLAQQALDPWSLASGGNFPLDDLRSKFRATPDDYSATSQLFVAESNWHQFYGRSEEALAAAEQAYQMILNHRLFIGAAIRALPNLSTAARLRAEAIEQDAPQAARKLRRRALAAAKKSVRYTRRIQTGLPYSLRELALSRAALGQIRRALKPVRLSCQLAEQQGARFELAQSRVVVAELSKRLGLPNADKLLSEAKEGMVEFEEVVDASAAMWNKKTDERLVHNAMT